MGPELGPTDTSVAKCDAGMWLSSRPVIMPAVSVNWLAMIDIVGGKSVR